MYEYRLRLNFETAAGLLWGIMRETLTEATLEELETAWQVVKADED